MKTSVISTRIFTSHDGVLFLQQQLITEILLLKQSLQVTDAFAQRQKQQNE